ncbi:MAG: ATP-binding protein [Acidimicrobiales bacterium]
MIAPPRLSDRRLLGIGRTICVASLLSAPVTIVLYGMAGRLSAAYETYAAVNAATGVAFGALGWFLVANQGRNRLVWLIVVLGFCISTPGVVNGALELLAVHQRVDRASVELAAPLSVVITALYSTWVIGAFGLPTFGLLLAPDGTLPSRRWRPVLWASAAVVAALYVTFSALGPVPEPGPEASGGWAATAQRYLFPLLILTVLLSATALLVRYRRAPTPVRRRLRWVLLGSTAAVIAGLGSFGSILLVTVGMPLFALCYGMAVWRDQLFDVDVVISRTLQFSALATFIGSVYVVIVYGIGALVGATDQGNQALSLAATVVVAFAFQPVRRRLEHGANRLVFGPRATPYEVLADLSARLSQAESTDGLLDRLVERSAAATGAREVVLWRLVDRSEDDGAGPEYDPVAAWPRDAFPAAPRRLTDAIEIGRAGVRLGAITVAKERGDDLSPTERRLLVDLAGSAGLVLEKARLDRALALQAAAVYASRRRLVDAQDEEHRRLELRLQGTIQYRLGSLRKDLVGAAGTARDDGVESIAAQLDALAEDAEAAAREITALARGLFPPALEADGLGPAIVGLAQSLPLPVEVMASSERVTVDGRVDVETELAAYFCVSEALTNTVKHANASAATVAITVDGSTLDFVVSDDGEGFSVESRDGNGTDRRSTGLLGLRDRWEAVGGRLSIDSAPGAGTTVTGSVGPSRVSSDGRPARTIAARAIVSDSTAGGTAANRAMAADGASAGRTTMASADLASVGLV